MFITCEHEPLDTLIPAQTDNRKKHWWHDDRNITFYKIVRTNQDFFSKKFRRGSRIDWTRKNGWHYACFVAALEMNPRLFLRGWCNAIDEKSLFAKQRSGDAFNDPRNPPWLGLDDEDDLSPLMEEGAFSKRIATIKLAIIRVEDVSTRARCFPV